MSNKHTIRPELESLQEREELLHRVICSKEEYHSYQELMNQNVPLPEGVYWDGDEGLFYRIYRAEDLSEAERQEYLFMKKIAELQKVISFNQRQQTQLLESIKNMVFFFVILTCVGIVGALLTFVRIF